MAIQAMVRTEAGNTTIQIVRPDGTIRASIGATETRGLLTQGEAIRRVLSRSNDHADVWSGHLNRYRISRYGLDGKEKTRIDRVSEWFRPYTNATPGAPYAARADPRIVSIHQDGDGLLWVAIRRAPLSFRPVGRQEEPRAEVAANPYFDLNQILHTTVEIIDPKKGELVARREFEEYVRFVSTPGDDVFTYSLRPDALGRLDCVVTPLKLRKE